MLNHFSSPSRDVGASPPIVAALGSSVIDARSSVIAARAGLLTALFGATVLVGWVLGIETLKSIFSGGASMKANAAAAFVLIGASLFLMVVHQPSWMQLAVGRILALMALSFGAATLVEYATGWNFGIDELLVTDNGIVYTKAPGRPAPSTALNFVLLAIALLLLRSPQVLNRRITQALTLFALFSSTLALVGYTYDVSSLYKVPPFSSMALHTAATFVVACFGILMARPDFEAMVPLRSANVGGVVARKLFPAILILPLLGWLRLQGVHLGLYDQKFGLALFTIVAMGILIAVVWWSARSLNQVDVTRSRVEEALRDSARVYQAIGDSIDYGIWLCNPDGTNRYTSPSFLKLVGLTQDQCSEFGWRNALHPADAARTIESWQECVKQRGKWDIEHRFRGVDGQWHPILARGVPVSDEQGNLLCWVGINLDIGQLKRAEQQLKRANDELDVRIQERTAELTHANELLRRSLEEKEVLLREVHHRVKNNLQVVSSLLHLQSLHSSDAVSIGMFRESQHRVQSMALVHERLYRSEDLAQVEFTDYLQGLAHSLFQAYNIDSSRIQLTINVDEVRLGIDTAVPCGLLINELVSNCLKHAFVGRDRGYVRIDLLAITEDDALLCVADDGIGLDPAIDPESTHTFGMQVVTALVDQLHGHLDIVRNAGTEFRIRFPRLNSSPRAALQ